MDKKDIDATKEQLLDSMNLRENSHLKCATILLFHHNLEKWILGAYIYQAMTGRRSRWRKSLISRILVRRKSGENQVKTHRVTTPLTTPFARKSA